MTAPVGALIEDSAGNFYGTTQQGGNGYGSIYEPLAGGQFVTPYNSTNGTDGAYPNGTLYRL